MMASRRPGLTFKTSLSVTHNNTKILPYLYLGGQEATSERDALTMLQVTHLINVTKELPHHFPSDFSYFQVPVDDSVEEDITAYFTPAHEFIESVRSSGATALVHCQTGMSRSSTIVLAHIMIRRAKQGSPVTLRDALAFVKSKRPRASPNGGFMAQLVELERSLTGTVTIDIDKYRSNRFGDVHEYCIGTIAPLEWTGEVDRDDDDADTA